MLKGGPVRRLICRGALEGVACGWSWWPRLRHPRPEGTGSRLALGVPTAGSSRPGAGSLPTHGDPCLTHSARHQARRAFGGTEPSGPPKPRLPSRAQTHTWGPEKEGQVRPVQTSSGLPGRRRVSRAPAPRQAHVGGGHVGRWAGVTRARARTCVGVMFLTLRCCDCPVSTATRSSPGRAAGGA